jgi:hypothetical protein
MVQLNHGLFWFRAIWRMVARSKTRLASGESGTIV